MLHWLYSELLVPSEKSGVFVEKFPVGEDSVCIFTMKELTITTLAVFLSFCFCRGHLQLVEILTCLETVERLTWGVSPEETGKHRRNARHAFLLGGHQTEGCY